MSYGSDKLKKQSETGKPKVKDACIQSVVQIIPTAEDDQANIIERLSAVSQILRLPSKQMKLFQNYLEYCPWEVIESGSSKIIELPETKKVTSSKEADKIVSTLRKVSLCDDDGVADICSDLIQRIRTGQTSSYQENETQTNLMVRPYLLEEPKVATVYASIGIQTVGAQCKTGLPAGQLCCCESSTNRASASKKMQQK